VLLRCQVAYADGVQESFAAYYGEEIGPIAGWWPAREGGYCFRAVPVSAGDGYTLYAQEWTNPALARRLPVSGLPWVRMRGGRGR